MLAFLFFLLCHCSSFICFWGNSSLHLRSWPQLSQCSVMHSVYMLHKKKCEFKGTEVIWNLNSIYTAVALSQSLVGKHTHTNMCTYLLTAAVKTRYWGWQLKKVFSNTRLSYTFRNPLEHTHTQTHTQRITVSAAWQLWSTLWAAARKQKNLQL